MRQPNGLEEATRDLDPMCDGEDVPFRRLLVLVESLPYSANALSVAARFGQATGGALRLVHVRAWDSPLPGGGRFYQETSEEATATLDLAMKFVWARGAEASGVIVEAQWSRTAAAVLTQAAEWGAQVIVLTAGRRWPLPLPRWDRTTRRVLRSAACPVLIVYPGRP